MQELPTVKSTPGAETGVATIPSATQGPTASDFFRPLRMSAEANRSTLGVETDSVTPELLMAASSKLLAINRREAESDPKDSMEFQRVYGPADYFAEHILRDGDELQIGALRMTLVFFNAEDAAADESGARQPKVAQVLPEDVSDDEFEDVWE